MNKALLFLVLTAGLCLAACKEESALPADPHVPLVNPFIGVWNADGEYWQFKTDGTGGRAATATGPFPNDFSFFVYAGQDVRAAPSDGKLIMIYDDSVTIYQFSFWGSEAELILPSSFDPSVTLEKVSGAPSALSLKNQLIGEWSAEWTSIHGLTWSLKYRADGTVKTFHHEVSHQFENSYAVRGNTLVIFGDMRFSITPVTADISDLGNGKLQVTETQTNPPPAEWVYTKVAAAKWKE